MNLHRFLAQHGSGIPATALVSALALGCSGDVSGSGIPAGSAAPSIGAPSGFGLQPLLPGNAGLPAPGAPVSGTDSNAVPGAIPAAPTPDGSLPETGGPAPQQTPSAPTGTPGTSLPYAPPEEVSPALEARAWKLTHEQYRASIESLLGVQVSLEEEGRPRLSPETNNGVFVNLSDAGFVSIANGLADGYMEIAEEVSLGVSEEQLAALGDCGELLPACSRDAFLGAALGKAFRRPASPDDLALFGELFDAAQLEAAAVGDDAFAYRSLLKGMLTSPHFLYRMEIGSDPAQQEFALTPHEVASFLSYSIVGAPPSDELMAEAAAGSLGDLAVLRSRVETLLLQPGAETEFERFMTEWLEVEVFLDPDLGLGRAGAKTAAGFDDVKAAMLAETESFIGANGTLDGTLTALLTAPVASDPALTTFYQSEPTGSGAATDRVGILALGAGLSIRSKEASTSPTLRGLFVRERLMCQHFEIPPGVNPDLSDLQAMAQPETTRELYELHALDPTCHTCHQLFDPIGFALEAFDEAGRFRTTQNGVPIDTSATLTATDVDQGLESHVDLANALADSTWVRECLARQAFRYYFGSATSLELTPTGTRREENRGLPPIQAGRAALAGEGDLRAMVVALLSSQSTLSRTRRDPEQL